HIFNLIERLRQRTLAQIRQKISNCASETPRGHSHIVHPLGIIPVEGAVAHRAHFFESNCQDSTNVIARGTITFYSRNLGGFCHAIQLRTSECLRKKENTPGRCPALGSFSPRSTDTEF